MATSSTGEGLAARAPVTGHAVPFAVDRRADQVQAVRPRSLSMKIPHTGEPAMKIPRGSQGCGPPEGGDNAIGNKGSHFRPHSHDPPRCSGTPCQHQPGAPISATLKRLL